MVVIDPNRLPRLPGPLRFARMAGSSIAAPGAAAWVTDFLNAAYYARAEDERDVADLRLAHGLLTTRWAGSTDRRLGARDVLALNRAYGKARLRGRGRLDRAALLDGSASLIGDWFAEAFQDDARRAHGIAFPDVTARDAYEPERRLRHAALGPMTPPQQPIAEQHWSTYEPVTLPDPGCALAFLTDPARWPDMGAAAGRFTALRSGGLEGQTFEIEVVAEPAPRSPVFTRGYVTCTAAHTEGEALRDAVATLADHYAQGADPQADPLLDAGDTPLALIVLTTHEGHFLGRALSHLLVWRDAGGTAWIRDIGAWDPLPWHLQAAYTAAGRAAQHDFWGPRRPERSMLAQLAGVTSGR